MNRDRKEHIIKTIKKLQCDHESVVNDSFKTGE